MKKLFGLLSTCFILIAIASCSNLNESSSLSLTFNGSDFARKSLARNISVSSEYEGYYLVLNLLGDYTEHKEIPFSDLGTYTVTFDSIPIGAEVYVEADAFNPNSNEFTHIYKGTSERISVSPGTNTVNLTMKSLTKNISTDDYGTISYSWSMMQFYIDDSYSNENNSIYFFNNGKFILQHTVFDGGTTGTSIVISEGLWSGNSDAFENGGTIQTTEYMYRNYETSQNGDGMKEVNFGNAVIVTDLITSNIEIIKEDEYSDPSLSFTSRNGLSFSKVH